MRIGLSILCERSDQKTGLTSLFNGFVRESLRLYPDVEFVVFCADGQGLEVESPRLTTVRGFPANDRRAARLFTEYFRIGPAAKRAGCDVLVTSGLVPLRASLPVAMHLFSLHYLSSQNELGVLRSLYRRCASWHGRRRAGVIITNTRFACDQILAVDPLVAPKLLQSYEGIDHQAFHSRRDEAEVFLLRERFGIVGRYYFWCSNFYPYKNSELLMETWCALPESIRDEVPLVMVGGGAWGGGDSKERTLDIAKRAGAAHQVKLLGWVNDEEVPILFRHAAVFVHPSREETFGRAVLEAMASGVPCVVQDIPVMHEVTGGNAIILDFNDRANATAALERALLDETLRSRLIAGGLVRAAHFSFERLAAERIEALRKLLGVSLGAHIEQYPPVYADSFSSSG